MRNINSKNISDANASGRGYSSTPWNIFSNPFNNSKNLQSDRSLFPECVADVLQSGRSMIEMLGVLAIIGVLSVGGIAGYSKAMQKYRINKAIEQITLIAGNIRTFFAPQKNYIGVGCSVNRNDGLCSGACMGYVPSEGGGFASVNDGCPIIKKAKILPDEMITVNAAGKITSITNPFGGGVELKLENKSTSRDYQAFSIGYILSKGDVEVCVNLLTQDWTDANVKYIRIAIWGSGTQTNRLKLPISIDSAVNNCSNIMTTNSVEVFFYFDIDLNGDIYKNMSWTN